MTTHLGNHRNLLITHGLANLLHCVISAELSYFSIN